MLRQTSLGSVGLVVGGILTIMGFVAYAAGNPTLNLAGFFLGIPLLLGGLALKVTELKPVAIAQPASSEVLALRTQQATSTQNQVRKDVTRYRYGQKVHLDTPLELLGLCPTNEEQPTLISLREAKVGESYALILKFESPHISFDTWQAKQEKIETFFGPGIRVVLSQPTSDQVELALISAVVTSAATGG